MPSDTDALQEAGTGVAKLRSPSAGGRTLQKAKTPARRPAFAKAANRSRLAAESVANVFVNFLVTFVAIFETVLEAAVLEMTAVRTAHVMTMDPPAPGTVAGDPNHLVVARPIARAMTVIRPVANFD